MNKSLAVDERMRNIIVSDKHENLEKIERILKAECLNTLRSYFEISSDDLNVNIMINENGKYDLQINAISRSIKFAKSF